MTTALLQSLFDKASALPEEVQEQFARQWLEELEDERLWDEQFAGSQDELDKMAEKALAEYRGRLAARGQGSWDAMKQLWDSSKLDSGGDYLSREELHGRRHH